MKGEGFELGKLPSAEERREILERARKVLTDARRILEQLDATEGRLPTKGSQINCVSTYLSAQAHPAT